MPTHIFGANYEHFHLGPLVQIIEIDEPTRTLFYTHISPDGTVHHLDTRTLTPEAVAQYLSHIEANTKMGCGAEHVSYTTAQHEARVALHTRHTQRTLPNGPLQLAAPDEAQKEETK